MSHHPETKSKAEKGEVDVDGSEKTVSVKEETLKDLILSSHAVLEEAYHAGRLKCSTCGGSRVFYCYTCNSLVGLNPQHVPKIKLPVKIDIIKHPNETDGKSTAVHAKLIAPDDVSIYTYPCIPELDRTQQNVVLVFPGPGAMTVEDLEDHFSKNGRKREAPRTTEQGSAKKPKLEQNQSKTSHSDHQPEEHSPEQECTVHRVIFIDSTWNQTSKIIMDERLQDLSQVELRSRKTCFWRHQRGSPDTYLATIEAVYYFLTDFHVHCLHREYRGEYDDLLFFYSFLRKLINRAKQDAGKL